ncbi:hypothetical protein ABIB26_004750, partial [Arthrobacter sp. UYEF20]
MRLERATVSWLDAMAADSPIIGYALTQTGGQLEKLGDVYDSA